MFITTIHLLTLLFCLFSTKSITNGDDINEEWIFVHRYPYDPFFAISKNATIFEIFNTKTKTFQFDFPSHDNLPKGGRSELNELKHPKIILDGDSLFNVDVRDASVKRILNLPHIPDEISEDELDKNFVEKGGSAVVEHDNTICVIGGYEMESRSLSNSVNCWNADMSLEREAAPVDRSSSAWISLPDMLEGRYLPAATVMDGKLFVSGGYDTQSHSFLNSVEVFDAQTQKWYSLPSMNHARSAHALTNINNKLYAIGGMKDGRYLNVTEVYDPFLNRWREIASMNRSRAKFAAVPAPITLSTKSSEEEEEEEVEGVRLGIYAIGGVDGFTNKNKLNSVEVLDVDQNRWIMLDTKMNGLKGPVSASLLTLS